MKTSLLSRQHTFDRIILVYSLTMVVVLLLLGRPLAQYLDEGLFYLFAAAVSVLLPGLIGENRGRVLTGVRYLYPVLLFTFFYRAAGGTVFLLFDQFFDAQLTSFERAVLGVNPTLYIDRHLLNPVLNELFSLGYFLYYPLIPVFMLVVYLRRDMDILRSSLNAVSLTFFLSYPLFFLYPIEGPRWFFADRFINAIESPVARPAVDFVIDNAAFHGGCVPSSHFAVALVILLYCRRYYRVAYRWVLPIVATLAVGTVWGRFHYVSDVVIGGIIGIVVTLLFWNHPGAAPETAPKKTERELAAHHAS